MDTIVIVSCVCLVLGFLFGRYTARESRKLTALREDVRNSARPVIAPPVDIRLPGALAPLRLPDAPRASH